MNRKVDSGQGFSPGQKAVTLAIRTTEENAFLAPGDFGLPIYRLFYSWRSFFLGGKIAVLIAGSKALVKPED